MFIKILTKTYNGRSAHYASLVENRRVDGKVVQIVKANLGPVTDEQIPFLKAAYALKKPRLVYDSDVAQGNGKAKQGGRQTALPPNSKHRRTKDVN